MTDQERRFDVVSVNITTSTISNIVAEKKTEENAEAVIMMAVARRGVEKEFYVAVSTGKYRRGDQWEEQP